MLDESRRRFLQLSGSTALTALAGVGAGANGEWVRNRPDGWCQEGLDDSLPEEYDEAESIDGIQREDEDELSTRDDVAYQCHSQGYQLCSNCTYFIVSQTADTVGGCVRVAGEVRSQDWCALYQETERLEGRPDPDPLGTQE